MTTKQPSDQPDQKTRIERLRNQLGQLGATATPLGPVPPDLEENFLLRLLEHETAPPIDLPYLLETSGVQLPAPEQLDESALTRKLHEIAQQLASFRTYLFQTNHLTDRELYEFLYQIGLREEPPLFAGAYIIDLAKDDNHIFLKHYADDHYRSMWAQRWTDYPMPDHEDPQFDRDRFLPQSPLTVSTGALPEKDDLIHLVISPGDGVFEKLGNTREERVEAFTNIIRKTTTNGIAGIHLNTEIPHAHLITSRDGLDPTS